jgi:hypothetical protein
MDNEQKFYVWVTGIICVSIVVLTLGIVGLFHIKHCKMIENNWTRGVMPGYGDPTWYKPSPE